MPERITIIWNFIEVVALTVINLFLFLTWMSFFTGFSIFISTIYGLGRLKRDIEKYHKGNIVEYFKYLIGKAKKN